MTDEEIIKHLAERMKKYSGSDEFWDGVNLALTELADLLKVKHGEVLP